MSELLDTGSFRVDRARALDKLIRFQLPDAELFALPWIRCAAASGAGRIEIRARSDEFQLAFDGDPLAPDDLRDPYRCLFDKPAPGSARLRELAVGLLTALRLRPKEISVISGTYGQNRFRLSLNAPDREAILASADPRSGTIVTVHFGSLLSTLNKKLAARLAALGRCSRARIILEGVGETGGWPAGFGEGLSFEEGELYGTLDAPAEVGSDSALAAYKLGAEAGALRQSLALAQVDGFVNDDGFSLNASQTAVARNRRFSKTMLRVGEKAVELLLRTARTQRERLAEVFPLLDDGWEYFWRDRLERRWAAESPIMFPPARWLKEPLASTFERLTDPSGYDDKVRRIRRAARLTDWLREAALKHGGGPGRETDGELGRALRAAPLLFSTDGRLLSLEELDLQKKSVGRILFSARRSPVPNSCLTAVYLSSGRDLAFLKEVFNSAVFDLSTALPPGTRRAAPGAATLERAGVGQILVRGPLESSGWSGEAALTLDRPERARLCFFRDGLPSSFLEHDCGLRFEAALAGTAENPGPEALRELALRTAPLYGKAGGDFLPYADEPAQQILLSHLLDFLVWTLDARSGAGEAHSWIRRKPLFRFSGRCISYEDFLAEFNGGEGIYTSPSNGVPIPGSPSPLVGEAYTPEILAKLLPGAGFLNLPSSPKTLLLFRRAGPAPAALPAAFPADLKEGLALTLSILQDAGAGAFAGNGPKRAFLLEAVGRLLAPWGPGPDELSLRDRAPLLELLRHIPVFRAPKGGGMTLEQAAQRLAAAPPLRFRAPGDRELAGADLILDADEEKLAGNLFPLWKDRLLRADAPAPAPAPARPEGPPFPRVPMSFARRYFLHGMTLELGLPLEYIPSRAGLRKGNGPIAELDPASLGISGWALLSDPEMPGAPSPRVILREGVRRFISEFAAQFPPSQVDGPPPGELRYLLELYCLQREDPASAAEAGWPALLEALAAAPLIPSLGGRVSLRTLAEKSSETGKVPFARRPLPAATPQDAWVPLIKDPWLQELLLRAVSPARLASYKLPAQAPPEPGADGPTLARLILVDLAGRRGQKVELAGADPLAAPLSKTILAAGLPPELQAAFLASVAATQVNRSARLLSDLDDGRFQVALARLLAPRPL